MMSAFPITERDLYVIPVDWVPKLAINSKNGVTLLANSRPVLYSVLWRAIENENAGKTFESLSFRVWMKRVVTSSSSSVEPIAMLFGNSDDFLDLRFSDTSNRFGEESGTEAFEKEGAHLIAPLPELPEDYFVKFVKFVKENYM